MIGKYIRTTVVGYFLRRTVRLSAAGLCIFCAAGILFGGFFAHAFTFLFLVIVAAALVLVELP